MEGAGSTVYARKHVAISTTKIEERKGDVEGGLLSMLGSMSQFQKTKKRREKEMWMGSTVYARKHVAISTTNIEET